MTNSMPDAELYATYMNFRNQVDLHLKTDALRWNKPRPYDERQLALIQAMNQFFSRFIIQDSTPQLDKAIGVYSEQVKNHENGGAAFVAADMVLKEMLPLIRKQ